MIIIQTMLTMTNTPSRTAAAKPEMTAETRQIVLKEIGSKWSKVSK
jgi:hypothetical protein